MNESGAAGVASQSNSLFSRWVGERTLFFQVPLLRWGAGLLPGPSPGGNPAPHSGSVAGGGAGRGWKDLGGQPRLGEKGLESVHPHSQTPTVCGPTQGVLSGGAPA